MSSETTPPIDDTGFRDACVGLLLLNGIPRDDHSARGLMTTYVETGQFVIDADTRQVSPLARQAIAMAVCTHLGVTATVTVPTQPTQESKS